MSATHGRPSTYRNARYKCRCDECREANTLRYREERQRRAERLAADPTLAPHGVASTYTNWLCRCGPCSEANADRCREYSKRRRAA